MIVSISLNFTKFHINSCGWWIRREPSSHLTLTKCLGFWTANSYLACILTSKFTSGLNVRQSTRNSKIRVHSITLEQFLVIHIPALTAVLFLWRYLSIINLWPVSGWKRVSTGSKTLGRSFCPCYSHLPTYWIALRCLCPGCGRSSRMNVHPKCHSKYINIEVSLRGEV